MLIQPYDSELWIYLSGFLGGARHAHGKTLRGLLRAQHEAIADWLEFLCGEMDIGSFGYDQKAEELAQLYRGLAATAQPS
jgi:hypothetical protein